VVSWRHILDKWADTGRNRNIKTNDNPTICLLVWTVFCAFLTSF
jgi:hypothetical protein